MNSALVIIVLALAAYLVGAIPFGFLIARLKGVDIRTVGSRNIGATNVFRSLGARWGIITFILDMGKGLSGSTLIPLLVSGLLHAEQPSAELRLLGGICAVAGHTWPVYLRFRGGKGVATSAGMLIGVAPLAVALGLAAWIVTFVIGRFVSLASITAALVLGVTIWIPTFRPTTGWVLPTALTLLASMIVIRHSDNIKRLCNKTESRVSFRRCKPDPVERPPK